MSEAIINVITENVLNIVIAVISIIVSYYVIPAIKNDLVPWLKDKHIYSIVKTFVQAAEKLAESGAIEKIDKKNEVIKLLKEQGVTVDEKVESFIESCVKELDLITSTAKEELIKNNE